MEKSLKADGQLLASAHFAHKVHARISFLEEDELFDHQKPFAFRYGVNVTIPQTNTRMKSYPVEMIDIRGFEKEFSLENSGFEIMDVGKPVSYEDMHDQKKVRAYFKVLEDLLKLRLGALHVEVFRHAVFGPEISHPFGD